MDFYALKISFLMKGGIIMNNVVTLNQLLNVGNAIQDNATKNEQYN